MEVGGKIEHQGVVTAVGRGKARVKLFESGYGCKGCAIAGFCHKPVEVDARIADASQVRVGSEVTVTAMVATRWLAIILLAAMPLLLLTAVLILASWLGASELGGGLVALGAVGLWFAILYLQRKNLNNTIHFKVSDIRS